MSVEQFEEDDGTIVLELCVAADDYGRVIGRGGRTAHALRTVVKAAAASEERTCSSTSSIDAASSSLRCRRWIADGCDRGGPIAEVELHAGRVGRAHGLDGSFYVTGARPRLLTLGTDVTVAGRTPRSCAAPGPSSARSCVWRASRTAPAREALRGHDADRRRGEAPALGEGEWWAHELEGCEVVDGERRWGRSAG